MPQTASLSCRLPIYAGPPGSGGFIVFPGRTFVADPGSSVALPTPGATPSPGYGQQGGFGTSYDWAYQRWLPVQKRWVTPDGSRYAYPGQDGIYIVNVVSGSLTELGAGQAWNLIDVGSDGAYVGMPQTAGLWLLTFSGTKQQITASGFWQAVGGGAAYGTATSAVPQGASNTIIRVDLKTGASQPWFMIDGGTSQVFGLDASGHPIIVSSGFSGPSVVWIVPSVGGATSIAVQSNEFQIYSAPVADSHGIWFASYQMMFIYLPGQGLFRAANIGGLLAGTCS
jgi:hypothetical protein